MPNAAKSVTTSVNWIAGIGGVAGLLAMFIPDVPAWMDQHGIAGWVTVLGLLILAPLLTVATVKARLNEQQLARAREQVERDRQQARKDVHLITELLDGWTVDSEFFETLVEDVDHNRFPVNLSRQIEDRWRRWDRDSREIKTVALKTKFDAVEDANRAYNSAIGEYMWTKDSGPRTERQYELLSVPAEWHHTQKRKAHDALADARFCLVRALRELFAVMHDYG
ncbi:hypothetical protein FE374_05085 [Georgenia yuyongxinii]|uniref:Uncharacterized protein n=1 Tax=Georgenia yuyongxinii TaxID=2589797 RepID=A0A5B8C826_9MICO|nr:hypothetical protein [Georgenia yuyongxinii]QDC24086.1 hypothetical protein FE374_05085 [Georgenia yuyongxinii]